MRTAPEGVCAGGVEPLGTRWRREILGHERNIRSRDLRATGDVRERHPVERPPSTHSRTASTVAAPEQVFEGGLEPLGTPWRREMLGHERKVRSRDLHATGDVRER